MEKKSERLRLLEKYTNLLPYLEENGFVDDSKYEIGRLCELVIMTVELEEKNEELKNTIDDINNKTVNAKELKELKNDIYYAIGRIDDDIPF